MPEIAAGRFLRHANRRELSDVVCPPYDVIDDAGRETLEARSPHNFVRLILPRDRAGDGPLERYRRSRELMDRWVAEGVLVRDEEPSLLVIDQAFTDPVTGARRIRRGLLALLRLSPPDEGRVLPHERTLSAPKEDRLQLLQTVGAHLSPIFALFPDEANAVLTAAGRGLRDEPDVTAELDGVTHELRRITDRRIIDEVRRLLEDRRAYIADGHHRYETALRHRELARAQGLPIEGTARDYVPAFLCSMSDPGLVVLPTHRVLHSLRFDVEELSAKLAPFAETERLDLRPEAEAVPELRARLAEKAEAGLHSFVLAPRLGEMRLVTIRPDADFESVSTLPSHPALRALDLSLLHGLVFEHALGLSRQSQERQENLRYVKRMEDSLDQVARGDGECAFLLNPTPLEQLRAVAEAGEVMPQKSTFFFPKIIDGFFVQPLEDNVP